MEPRKSNQYVGVKTRKHLLHTHKPTIENNAALSGVFMLGLWSADARRLILYARRLILDVLQNYLQSFYKHMTSHIHYPIIAI